MSLPFPKVTIIAWIISLVRALLYSLIVAGGFLVNALRIHPWGEMTGNDRAILILMMLGAQSAVVLAFMDQTIADLKKDSSAPSLSAPPRPGGELS